MHLYIWDNLKELVEAQREEAAQQLQHRLEQLLSLPKSQADLVLGMTERELVTKALTRLLPQLTAIKKMLKAYHRGLVSREEALRFIHEVHDLVPC